MKKLIHTQYGFVHATWNFTESSHGKGSADGVGGLIQGTADSMVNLGNDAKSLFNSFNGMIAVNLFMLDEENFLKVDKIVLTAES
jgi:hypothetical protein